MSNDFENLQEDLDRIISTLNSTIEIKDISNFPETPIEFSREIELWLAEDSYYDG